MQSVSNDPTVKKRKGTSGIHGHLFETKLISLILFRLLHDDGIEEFYLASNMDEIEAFDDVVLKVKIIGHDRPILAFIQAKHKENEESFLSYELIKNFYASYTAVKQKFYTSKSKDVFFNGKFDDTDCVFILYTNAKYYDDTGGEDLEQSATSSTAPSKQVRKAYQSKFSKKLDELIGTSEKGSCSSQADYSKNDLVFANEEILEEEITVLAEHFVKFLINKTNQAMNILLDKYMLQYHYILAQSVVDITEVKTEDPSEEKQEENKPCVQKQEEKRSGVQEEKQVSMQTQENKSGRQKHKENIPCGQKQENGTRSEQKQEQKKSAKQKQKEKKPSEQKQEEKWRYLSFRPSFFCTDDKILAKLRKKIFELIIKNEATNKNTGEVKKNKKSKDAAPFCNSVVTETKKYLVDFLISTFLAEPSAITLGPLIGAYIITKNGTLKFIVERPESDVQKLEQIEISQATIDEAEAIAATNILKPLRLKVPVTFGNLDLAISGNAKKVDKRLNTLTDFFIDLCKKSQFIDPYEIVTVDESIGDGFLSLTNGIGSAVGNLLIYDDATKYLKFADDSISLQINARTLFEKLNSTELDLKLYRFDVKAIMTFPKLVMDYTDEAEKILSKLVIYDKQSSHTGVEDTLKKEIERLQSKKPNNLLFKTDTVIIYYHHEIQSNWMSSKSSYYTKKSDIYRQAINNIVTEPQISALRTTYNMNTQKYFGYYFSEHALEALSSLKNYSKVIIVTDLSTLTTIKVTQYFRNTNDNKYAVLDLECMLNLPIEDFTTLTSELTKTEKVPIIVCEYMKNSRSVHTRLEEIARATVKKTNIVVTNKDFIETIQEYFPGAHVLDDERQSLIGLTPQSQMDLIKSAQVIFQGHEISLDSFVDDMSVEFIKGAVLNKVVREQTIYVGESLSTSSYEGIKHLYVNRRVSQGPNYENNLNYNVDDDDRRYNIRLFKTLDDIRGETVLIAATPGMGKSTLLTHLSLKTKELHKKLWIVRINLLDYSKVFHDWKVDGTVIDTLETLKFICHVITKNDLIISLKENNNKVYLDGCTGEEWASFEINMLLHYYNERQLLLLFDGFDEICPHYKEIVIEFLNVVKNYPHKHRMWVTSRPYSEILEDLERILGKAYRIDFINDSEQDIYLETFWRNNLIIGKLNDIQLSNVISFINYMITKSSPKIGRVAYLFYDYVYSHFPHVTYQSYAGYIPVAFAQDPMNLRNGLVKRRVDIIMGTPLLLHLYAEYFVNLIRIGCTDFSKIYVEYSSLTIYEIFIETKLKKILFHEKNKMDVYNPDVIKRYEKERKDCVAMHKKMATYALLFHKIRLDELKDWPFNEDALIEYGAMVNEIRNGAEKTGLVSHVTADNIPVFIYRTLAEYFAAEFVCDILKSSKFGFGHKNIWFTVGTMTYDILAWVNKKRGMDRELNCILGDIERKRPYVVDCYGFLFATGWSKEHIIRIRSSVKEDYEDDCFDEYNNSYLKLLRRLELQEADVKVREFQKNVIAKMKPHLKRYFTPSHEMISEPSTSE